jgi:phage-related protein
MAITSAISDLFKSFYELFASVLNAAYTVIHSIFLAVYNFVTGIFTLAGDLLGGLVDVTGSVGKFVASNIVVFAIAIVGVFAYVRFTAQGQRVVADKKTN